MSNEICNLATALATVQATLPRIIKGERANAGTYSYSYASLADIHAEVLPRLAAAGLAWSCTPKIRDDGRYVLVCTLLHGLSGETLSCEFPLPQQARPQELGSAITYARRYALCSVVGIAADEDDDGQAAQAACQQQQEQRPQERRTSQKRQNTKPSNKPVMKPHDALNAAVQAGTPEELREIWRACDLNAPVRASDFLALVQVGIEGETLGDVLKAIGEHVKTTGGPVMPLWDENA